MESRKNHLFIAFILKTLQKIVRALVTAKESAAQFVQGDINEDEFTKKSDMIMGIF